MAKVETRTPDGKPAATGPPAGKHVCVYLGGRLGRDQRVIDNADALGRRLAAEGIGLVYGGASIGLMGALANATLEEGGYVTGVIPRQLSYQELAHEGLSRIIEVNTMHERKHLMQSLVQGCIALPGGFGTIEEIFEALTWSQIPVEMHEKPCVFANIDGYFDHMFEFLDHAVERGLLLPHNRDLAMQAPTATGALEKIQTAWAEEEQAILDVIKSYEA